ncbi:MAG: 4Fe-4S binding protein [Candidatus Sumerlaeia bacterium]
MKIYIQNRFHRFGVFVAALVLLPIVGGIVGRLAAHSLSRMDYSVRVAERLYLEEKQQMEEQTLETEAYRAQGMPAEFIYERATMMRGKYRVGATILGVFLGLVVAMKIGNVFFKGKRSDYEADYGYCLACGRCYDACPVEHQRKREKTGETIPEPNRL